MSLLINLLDAKNQSLMAIAFMGFLIFYCWTTFHLDAAVVQVSKPLSNKVNRFLSSNLLQVSSSHISCFLELFFLSFDQDLDVGLVVRQVNDQELGTFLLISQVFQAVTKDLTSSS